MQRIPTLDGWRGFAILLVLASHVQAGLTGHVWRFNWMDVGKHGVTIFFVLSGFLITSRILDDPSFRLATFYRRRFFRLAPVALLYLAVIVLLRIILHARPIATDLWSCLFLFRNYVAENPSNALTSHFWSLSIEEQFYLFWPSVLVLFGRRLSLRVAGVIVAGIALFRLQHWDAYLAKSLRTEVRMDALLVGCALALLMRNTKVRQCFLRYNTLAILFAASVFLLCVYRFQVLMPLQESLAIAVLLGCTSAQPGNRLSRILEARPLKFLGVISYSLYLWQELFLVPHWGKALAPFMFALLFVTAYLSYELIERPCIAFGRRRKNVPSAYADRSSPLHSELSGVDS